jgi:hypothetical protein
MTYYITTFNKDLNCINALKINATSYIIISTIIALIKLREVKEDISYIINIVDIYNLLILKKARGNKKGLILK